MTKAILLCASLTLSSFAMSVNDVVKLALKNNYDLKNLEQAIAVTSHDVAIATKWKNPTITLGINDVQSDISKRNLEPMQAQYLGLSQTIPLGNKLEIKKDIAQDNQQLAKYTLENAQLKLASNIHENVYLLNLAKKRLELLSKYQNNIKQLENLTYSLYENGQANQNDIINTQVLFSKLELKKISLKNAISNYRTRLEEITYTKLDNIDITLKPIVLKNEADFSNHPRVQLLKQKQEKLQTVSQLELAQKNSDMKFNMAYFNRDDKYKDYMNFSISMPLSLYKSENIKSAKAKEQASQIASQLFDLKHRFASQLKILTNNMESTKKQFELLQTSIIPKKEQIQKNIETYNALNKINPKMTISNLNTIIDFELQSLQILETHFKNYAKSLYFTGKI